jgi:hypothetical protein
MTLFGASLSQAKTIHLAHRHHLRAAHAAAGVVDVAASVTSPWTGPAWQGVYYGPSPWGDYECKPPHAFECRPYASWGAH